MKRRSDILTAWLIILIAYNSYQLLGDAFSLSIITLLSSKMDFNSEEMKETINENELSEEDAKSAISNLFWWSSTSLVVRITALISLGLLFLWKKSAFWGYCSSVAAAFSCNKWGGSTLLESSLDLMGLIILVALIHLIEPVLWPQLD